MQIKIDLSMVIVYNSRVIRHYDYMIFEDVWLCNGSFSAGVNKSVFDFLWLKWETIIDRKSLSDK